MAADKDLALLKRQLDQAQNAFTGDGKFRSARQSWDKLITRRAPIKLEDSIAEYADGIDIESPMLEEDRGTHVKILMLDGPKIDATALDKSEDAKKDVEDIRLWSAASLYKQNLGHWASNVISQGQVQYGVAVMRKRWHMPKEPKPEDMKPGAEGADAELKARNEWYKAQKNDCFELEYVSPFEMSWFPVHDPEIIFQVSQVPYIDAKDLTNDKGERLTIDQKGKIAFLGHTQPDDEWVDDDLYDKKITLIVRDMKDKKTGQWTVSEYVSVDGGTDEATKLKTYANPLGRSMYFVIPSGDEVITEHDPHLRYRPMMYSELVLVQEYNYLKTLIASLARKKITDEDVYVDIAQLRPEGVQMMEEAGLIEGVGAQRRLVFKRPTPNSGEIMVAPTLSRWPNDVEEHLMLMFQDTKEELARVRPNRFLTGQAYQEAKEGTGAAVLSQQQAAALPYGAYLVKQELFWKQNAEAEHNAIRYWDKASPEGTSKPYYVTATPDLPLLKGGVEDGKSTMINAEKLERNFVVTVRIKNETQQEKAINDQMAYNDRAQGTITEEQLLKRLGHDDPEGQMERLEEQRMEKMFQPRADQILMQAIETQFSALTFLNLTQMAGGAPMQPTPQGQGQPQAQDTVKNVVRPSITPPPIPGAGGSGMSPTGVAGT